MKIQHFSAGKNTRLAPYLLKASAAVEYTNIDNEKASLRPVNKSTISNSAIANKYAYYFQTKDTWLSSATEREYVEWQEKVYISEANTIPKVSDGTVENNLGIAFPNEKPAVALGTGTLSGTYTYVYTYYNSTTGVESAPSYLSDEITTTTGVNLSNLKVSVDSQVDTKRIYRIGGSLTQYSLVATIPNSQTTYSDNLADSSIPGDLLISTDYYQAPYGLRYITEAYAMLFGAVGDKLYFTHIGKPWAWPKTYFIDFPLPITGIGVISIGILVFTAFETYIVTGTTPATLSRYKLTGTQGCVNNRTIQNMEGTLLWVSNDGVCASSGGKPKVISRQALGTLDLKTITAIVHNEQYYLQHSDGILVLDTRYGDIWKDLSINSTFLVTGEDKVYAYISNKYYELFSGTSKETFTYLSPQFLDGAFSTRKTYKHFYLRSSGDITITVYIDGKEVYTWNLNTEDTHDLDIPQEKKNGYSVQFKITGTGEVYELGWTAYG